jgi:hypothetical protein
MFGAFVTALISSLEPLKHQLHIEMTQKLTSTDHLLKENIAKLVHSKVIIYNLFLQQLSWRCVRFVISYLLMFCISRCFSPSVTLSNPIFLPSAYSPALTYFGWERGWWITCNYPTTHDHLFISKHMACRKTKSTVCAMCWLKSVLHEEKHWTGSDSGAGEQTQQNSVGRFPTSERNRKIIMSDEV